MTAFSKKQRLRTLFLAVMSITFLVFVTSLYLQCMKYNFEVAPFFLLIYIIYYPISFYLIKKYVHQLRGMSIREFKMLVNKPFLVTYPLLITALFVCFVVQSVTMNWYYIFGAIFCAATVTGCYFFVRWVYSEQLRIGRGRSKRLVEKVIGDSFFLGGVDIFDENNREKIDFRTLNLVNPYTKKVVYEADELYKIKGRQFNFYVALKNFDGVKVVYLTSFRDYYKLFVYNFNDYRVHDIMQNKRLENSAFIELIRRYAKPGESYNDSHTRCTKITENDGYELLCELVLEASQDLYIDTSHKESRAEKVRRVYNYYTAGEILISRHVCLHKKFESLEEATAAAKDFMNAEQVNLRGDPKSRRK